MENLQNESGERVHAGVVSAKPPPMLKLVRKKDSWEKKSGEWFHRVFVCVISRTLGF